MGITSERWRNALSGLAHLRGYERSWLRPDLLAGITVAAYAIPQVMAYAQIAGLPAKVGLITFAVAVLAYAVFGSSHRLSVGPESTTALMSAVAVSGIVGRDSERFAALTAALALVVGVMCLVSWLLGLGFIADLLSKPVLVGYMAGVAVMMIVSQTEKLTGIASGGDTIIEQIRTAWSHREDLHVATLVLAAILLALLLLGQRFLPTLPFPLFVVLIGTFAVWAFDLDERFGIDTIGAIDGSLPMPTLPTLDPTLIGHMLLPALGIAVVAYSDNILTGRAFAEEGEKGNDPDQEFLALGGANVAVGFFGGFPVSSSGSRTAIGASLHSKSQVHALVAAAVMVLTVVFLGGLLGAFPKAALGALVVYAALRLIEVAELRRIARFRTSELLLTIATTVAVVVTDVLTGIMIAIGLSLADLVRRVARPHAGVLGYVPGYPGMHDIDDFPVVREVPGLVVFRYDSPLFFANADNFVHRAEAAVADAERRGPVHWLLLNAEANVEVDLTSLDALGDLRDDLHARGISLRFARAKTELQRDIDRAGLGSVIREEHSFPTLPTAVEAYLRWHEAEFGHLPEGMEIPERARDFLTETPDH